jgi:hypothetical protein
MNHRWRGNLWKVDRVLCKAVPARSALLHVHAAYIDTAGVKTYMLPFRTKRQNLLHIYYSVYEEVVCRSGSQTYLLGLSSLGWLSSWVGHQFSTALDLYTEETKDFSRNSYKMKDYKYESLEEIRKNE